jgi:hypothetical protein
MRKALLFCALFLFAALAHAGEPVKSPGDGAHSAVAYGKRDGKVPGWAITTQAPAGWTQDCCLYANAIGVNLVLYRGEWTGEPDRVMVLNVWPRKLPTLDAEWQDDQKRYLQRDPAAKVSSFPIANPGMACHGTLYQGTDHIDDAVAICDPGKATGIRLSWSMTVAAAEPSRQQVLELFKQVVEQSTYRKDESVHGNTAVAGR